MAVTIRVEHDEYPDQWVDLQVSPAPVKNYFAVQKALTAIGTEESFETLFTALGPFVVAWSWPEEPGADGLWARDLNYVIDLGGAWLSGVAEVPLPLRRRPTDGTPSEEPQA